MFFCDTFSIPIRMANTEPWRGRLYFSFWCNCQTSLSNDKWTCAQRLLADVFLSHSPFQQWENAILLWHSINFRLSGRSQQQFPSVHNSASADPSCRYPPTKLEICGAASLNCVRGYPEFIHDGTEIKMVAHKRSSRDCIFVTGFVADKWAVINKLISFYPRVNFRIYLCRRRRAESYLLTQNNGPSDAVETLWLQEKLINISVCSQTANL